MAKTIHEYLENPFEKLDAIPKGGAKAAAAQQG
jgi:hypothetical protein